MSVSDLHIPLGLRGVTITAAAGDGASHFAFGPFSGGIGDDLDTIICSEMNMPVYPTGNAKVPHCFLYSFSTNLHHFFLNFFSLCT